MVQLVADGFNDERKAMNGSRVLLLGVAYKKDIDDVRESPALSIIDRLRAKGADVRYHDPFVKEVHFDDAHTVGGGEPLQSVPLTDEELRAADCVVIVTDHSGIDYQRVCQLTSLIVDTRNALNGDLRRDSSARAHCSTILVRSCTEAGEVSKPPKRIVRRVILAYFGGSEPLNFARVRTGS